LKLGLIAIIIVILGGGIWLLKALFSGQDDEVEIQRTPKYRYYSYYDKDDEDDDGLDVECEFQDDKDFSDEDEECIEDSDSEEEED